MERFAEMLEGGSAPGLIALGGHRGLGMNGLGGASRPKFRENTVSSLLAAARAGATFVEFDVQVTSDGVAVLFHDNYVVHGDAAEPCSYRISDLSLPAFKGFAPAASDSDYDSLAGGSDEEPGSAAWVGAGVLGGSPPRGGSPSKRLMRKHRHDLPATPFEEGLHLWEAEEEDHLPSLAEVFAAVPPHVAFDIELKMTTPNDWERTPHEEVHRIVDATLAAVDAAQAAAAAPPGAPRDVMFSSFDPEVCVEVKRRRPHDTVMFLSGGGAYAHVDARRTSVASAIEFAAGSGLQGVILEASVVQAAQHAVAAARAAGLRVMTYGTANDDPGWVQRQAKLGVAGCIVDDVAGIAAALRAVPAGG